MKRKELIVFICILVVTAVTLLATIIPGVFIIDEDNYLASVHSLKNKQLSVPGTESILESRELLFFLPNAQYKSGFKGKIVSNAPPLYSIIALPFSFLGWRGLVGLNILSYILLSLLVFYYTRHYSQKLSSAWVAMFLCMFACYQIEYAQGVWPHCLSSLLCFGGFVLASKAKTHNQIRYGILSGLCLGVASGVRYQNIIMALCVLSAVAVFAKYRVKQSLAFLSGIVMPITLSSFINHARYGTYNPISKGGSYLRSFALEDMAMGRARGFIDTTHSFMSKFVDYSFAPMPVGFSPAPSSKVGAILCMGIVKKAFLQSAPWVVLVLAGCVIILFSKKIWSEKSEKNNELLSISVILGSIIMLFSIAGTRRYDGLCFNQRYFFDLLPFCAVAFSLFTEENIFSSRKYFLAGIVTCLITASILLSLPSDSTVKHIAILKLPLLAGSALAISWLTARNGLYKPLFSFFAAFAIVWAVAVHLREDLKGSRYLRNVQCSRYINAKAVLTKQPTAIFGYWGHSLYLGPLLLSHPDLVIADPWIDNGKDAALLLEQFISQGRRVLIVVNGFPKSVFNNLTKNRNYRRLPTDQSMAIIEILPHMESN